MIAFTLLSLTLAHTSISYPPTRGHPLNPFSTIKDYKCITTPFNGGPGCAPKSFPCHYPHDTKVVTSFKAGQVVKVKFYNPDVEPIVGNEGVNQARHNGGLCEFSLSYDEKKFIKIATYHKSCPDIFYDWPVKIPEDAPSCERCTFAWSWMNASGNREFYMNCADVKIEGKEDGVLGGEEITIGNLPGYPTLTPEGDSDVAINTKGSGPSKSDVAINLKEANTARLAKKTKKTKKKARRLKKQERKRAKLP